MIHVKCKIMGNLCVCVSYLLWFLIAVLIIFLCIQIQTSISTLFVFLGVKFFFLLLEKYTGHVVDNRGMP